MYCFSPQGMMCICWFFDILFFGLVSQWLTEALTEADLNNSREAPEVCLSSGLDQYIRQEQCAACSSLFCFVLIILSRLLVVYQYQEKVNIYPDTCDFVVINYLKCTLLIFTMKYVQKSQMLWYKWGENFKDTFNRMVEPLFIFESIF